MSEIKVNSIKNTNSNDGGVAIDSSGHVQVDGLQMPTIGPLSNRNLIINGAMQIAQRNDDFQPPASGDYTLDRFQAYMSSADAYDVQRVTDTPSGQGFKHSLKVTSNAATSVGADGYYYLGQKIEGNNWVQMGYGASGAKKCTVSFWVKSSLAGTHSGILKNSAQDRSLAFEYTISSANTWEYKQITIAGDTSGTWLTGSGIGVWVYFSMGVGTTYGTGTANTWEAANLVGTTGSVDLVATSGATWFITGLQVEQGEKATPFEHRSIGDEFARCQRYYCHYGHPFTGVTVGQRVGAGFVTAPTQAHMILPTGAGKMRANPTPDHNDVEINDAATNKTISNFGTVTAYNGHVHMTMNTPSGLNEGRACNIRFSSTSGNFFLNAEL